MKLIGLPHITTVKFHIPMHRKTARSTDFQLPLQQKQWSSLISYNFFTKENCYGLWRKCSSWSNSRYACLKQHVFSYNFFFKWNEWKTVTSMCLGYILINKYSDQNWRWRVIRTFVWWSILSIRFTKNFMMALINKIFAHFELQSHFSGI